MAIEYSDEQLKFVDLAQQGKNLLVKACIGSGKTTAIQHLCNIMRDKRILYLTYNKLLKLDAKAKIQNRNVTVQNYHGYAYNILKQNGVRCAISQLIKTYNSIKPKDATKYDILVLDEYQDIDEDISKMLSIIKERYPDLQLIAVGDMDQKIYDYTSLDVSDFIDSFLGDYEQLSFSRCFRLSERYAKMLGDTWNKPIIGVNENCSIEIMNKDAVVALLEQLEPRDILCLGARYGDMVDVLNILETERRDKFNKFTTYASISDRDKGRVDPKDDVAIFTTFDSSKGLERRVCVVFDFDDSYWQTRKSQPNVKYDILKNIFLVAASRGKERIIFCTDHLLDFKTIGEPFDTSHDFSLYPFNASEMFDYKYNEDICRAFADLDVTKIDLPDTSVIDIKSTDGLIDMSPCIGIFTNACFFKNFDIDKRIQLQLRCNGMKCSKSDLKELTFSDMIRKIRYSVFLSTKQRRYFSQSRKSFVTEEDERLIKNRLSTLLPPDCQTQISCGADCKYTDADGNEQILKICGLADAMHDGKLYEVKFVHEISPEQFLQLATYMLLLDVKIGRIWNIKNNDLYEVRINDRKALLDHIIQAITKGVLTEFVPV